MLEPVGDVSRHRQMREKGAFLKHKTDAAFLWWKPNAVSSYLDTVDLNDSRILAFESGQYSQEGRLSAAARSHRP